jgi:very-short-patch-repair endonuclease
MSVSEEPQVRRSAIEANRHRVQRYWSYRVLSNIDGALEDILGEITTTPTPNPSPQGGGEHTELAA